MRHTYLTILLLCLVHPTQGQDVYKTTNKDGQVIYTDAPRDAAEKLEMAPLNIQDSVRIPKKKEVKKDTVPAPSYTISLQSPNNGQRFGPASRSLPVSVNLNRNLMKDYTLTYYFDGIPTVQGTRNPNVSIPLPVIARGKRTVRVSVMDPSGKAVASTAAATIHVIRPN